MTQVAFIRLLNSRQGRSDQTVYNIEGDWIIITSMGISLLNKIYNIPEKIMFGEGCNGVYLESLQEVPKNIIFSNSGDVSLAEAIKLSPDVQFNNIGLVKLNYIDNLPAGLEFNNEGNVILPSLKYIGDSVKFNNKGKVFLTGLKAFNKGVEFNNTGGLEQNVMTSPEGVDSKRFINTLIKLLYR